MNFGKLLHAALTAMAKIGIFVSVMICILFVALLLTWAIYTHPLVVLTIILVIAFCILTAIEYSN